MTAHHSYAQLDGQCISGGVDQRVIGWHVYEGAPGTLGTDGAANQGCKPPPESREALVLDFLCFG